METIVKHIGGLLPALLLVRVGMHPVVVIAEVADRQTDKGDRGGLS